MANEGGFIYGQDDNPNAKPSKDKTIGKVEVKVDDEKSVDNCNLKENVKYSDAVKGEACDE